MSWVIVFAAYLLIFGVPFWIILNRAGLNPNFAFFVIVPVGGVLCVLAVLAFSEWPVFTSRWED